MESTVKLVSRGWVRRALASGLAALAIGAALPSQAQAPVPGAAVATAWPSATAISITGWPSASRSSRQSTAS
jgi:hypothetical protein